MIWSLVRFGWEYIRLRNGSAVWGSCCLYPKMLFLLRFCLSVIKGKRKIAPIISSRNGYTLKNGKKKLIFIVSAGKATYCKKRIAAFFWKQDFSLCSKQCLLAPESVLSIVLFDDFQNFLVCRTKSVVIDFFGTDPSNIFVFELLNRTFDYFCVIDEKIDNDIFVFMGILIE